MSELVRVMIVGASGQVGTACAASVPNGIEARCFTHAALAIGDAALTARCVAEFRPRAIINAAAYTAVDKAESEPDSAHRVNVTGAENLAEAARVVGAFMIHLSTDFVFDGSASRPYATCAAAKPLSVYGATKFAGEERVREILGQNAAVLRTAWVYSARGSNFVN